MKTGRFGTKISFKVEPSYLHILHILQVSLIDLIAVMDLGSYFANKNDFLGLITCVWVM